MRKTYCTAGFRPGSCPLWVKLDRRGQSRMVIYVRFAPKADKVGDKAPGPLCAMNGHRAIRAPRRRARVGQAKSGNSVHTVAQGALEAGLEKSPKFLSSCAVGCSQKAPK